MNANVMKKKLATRLKRKKRVRAKISGTAERPRVSVFRSNKHFYAQAIDDVAGATLAACDGAKMNLKANKEDAKKTGDYICRFTERKKHHNDRF
jgi:large subunit ribosomal protein L18